jgi:ribosomal protein S18 acetylase RimI-like enzyme
MECRVVEDADTRMDFAHLTTLSFDIPFATSKAIYERPEAWQGDYVGYVGYVNRRAVCTVALVVSDEAIGVYSVSTLPEYRRRGHAEALMRRVLKDAQQVSGLERTILQSTRAGHEMYRRMGYRDITNYSVHIL